MTEACVMLGKVGDLLSVLPLLQHFSNRDRKPVNLIVSREYFDVVAGLDYITPIIYQGHWQDLAGAVLFAKKHYDKVIVPQTYGKTTAIEKRTPSFQYDQWLRAGGLPLWDKLPLTINRNEKGNQTASLLGNRPTILVADGGESSPFEFSERLIAKLTARFGKSHLVLSTAGLRLERFTDFIHCYDAASAIVVTETAHLHLAKATKTPVFALVTDKPSRWHGSAWSSRHKLHIRYSHYERREDELIESMAKVIGGETLPKVMPLKCEQPHGYNPSIIEYNDRKFTSYRYHPNPTQWRTKIVIGDWVDGFPQERPLLLEGIYNGMSQEDGRLFLYRGKLHMSLTVSVFPGSPGLTIPCAMVYGELKYHGAHWTLEPKMVKYGMNNFAGQEKNWVFFEHEGCLYYNYQCGIVCRLDSYGEAVDQVYQTTSPSWSHGELRGGTQPLPYQGKWLRFFHSLHKQGNDRRNWTYCMGAMVMDNKPPFAVERISKWPIYNGDERYFPNWQFYKAGVVIPYGAIQNDDGWTVSVGINDGMCGTMELKERDLNL